MCLQLLHDTIYIYIKKIQTNNLIQEFVMLFRFAFFPKYVSSSVLQFSHDDDESVLAKQQPAKEHLNSIISSSTI